MKKFTPFIYRPLSKWAVKQLINKLTLNRDHIVEEYKISNYLLINYKIVFNTIKKVINKIAIIRKSLILKKRSKRRRRPYIQFFKFVNNMFIEIRNVKSQLLFSSSICSLTKIKTRDRFGITATKKAAEIILSKLRQFRIHLLDVKFRCFITYGMRSLLRILSRSKGLKFKYLIDYVRIPHGRMKLKKKRRI